MLGKDKSVSDWQGMTWNTHAMCMAGQEITFCHAYACGFGLLRQLQQGCPAEAHLLLVVHDPVTHMQTMGISFLLSEEIVLGVQRQPQGAARPSSRPSTRQPRSWAAWSGPAPST